MRRNEQEHHPNGQDEQVISLQLGACIELSSIKVTAAPAHSRLLVCVKSATMEGGEIDRPQFVRAVRQFVCNALQLGEMR